MRHPSSASRRNDDLTPRTAAVGTTYFTITSCSVVRSSSSPAAARSIADSMSPIVCGNGRAPSAIWMTVGSSAGASLTRASG